MICETTKVKIYCPECEEYSAEIVGISTKEGISKNIACQEIIAKCRCTVCVYEWELVLAVNPIQRTSKDPI